METTSCNWCGSDRYSVFLDNLASIEFNEEFRLVKCKKCGLIYLNQRPTKKEIGRYYPPGYWPENCNAENTSTYLYKLVRSYISGGSVLDIGAGTGLLLNWFKKRGWKVDGVEISPVAGLVAKRKFKINLRIGDFLDVKLPENKFDLITLNHVLEHVYEPRQTINKVAKLVKKGGMVMISCPNIEGIGPYLFKNKWYAVDAPRHLYQFNYLTLSRMLERAGFKILKVDYSFYWDNFYALFESFRRAFSPRFDKKGGNIYESNNSGAKTVQSPVKKAGILVAKALSGIIAAVEPVAGRGEVITILAKKI